MIGGILRYILPKPSQFLIYIYIRKHISRRCASQNSSVCFSTILCTRQKSHNPKSKIIVTWKASQIKNKKCSTMWDHSSSLLIVGFLFPLSCIVCPRLVFPRPFGNMFLNPIIFPVWFSEHVPYPWFWWVGHFGLQPCLVHVLATKYKNHFHHGKIKPKFSQLLPQFTVRIVTLFPMFWQDPRFVFVLFVQCWV